MKLVEARQVEFEEVLNSDELDLIIAASGYESRARSVPEKLGMLNGRRGVALGFTDRESGARADNDAAFNDLGYRAVSAEGDAGERIAQLLLSTMADCDDGTATIVLDYTSMTRVWYASAIRTLAELESGPERVTIYFTYTPSSYSEPSEPTSNRHMGPIPGFSHLTLPDRRTALILGLGYERQRALGLAEYVEAAETFAFMADPALDPAFVKAVIDNNQVLLKRLPQEHFFNYPLTDLQATSNSLGSLCAGLTPEYRVILAPLGPKPFTLLCLLHATGNPGIDVWRVSAGPTGVAYDREPIEPVVVAKTVFASSRELGGQEQG